MRTEFTASVMSVPVSHPFVISSHVSAVPNWEGMQSNAFMKPNTNLVPRDKTTKAVPAQTRGGAFWIRRAVWEAEANHMQGRSMASKFGEAIIQDASVLAHFRLP